MGLAISSVEHAIRQAVARIDTAEREQLAVVSRLDTAAEQLAADQARAAERLKHVEEVAGPRSAEALRLIEETLGRVSSQLAEDQVRLTRLEAADDPATLIEEVVTRLGQRMADAEARTGEALAGLKDSLVQLDQRMNAADRSVRSDMDQRLGALGDELAQRVEAARTEIAERLATSARSRSRLALARWPTRSPPSSSARPGPSSAWAARCSAGRDPEPPRAERRATERRGHRAGRRRDRPHRRRRGEPARDHRPGCTPRRWSGSAPRSAASPNGSPTGSSSPSAARPRPSTTSASRSPRSPSASSSATSAPPATSPSACARARNAPRGSWSRPGVGSTLDRSRASRSRASRRWRRNPGPTRLWPCPRRPKRRW